MNAPHSPTTAHYRYQMTVAYDGTHYAGWQIQPRHPTIQSEMERALRDLTGEKSRIHSSGRTDAGVHARGQSAHVDITARWEPRKLRLACNARLPPDIRVLSVKPVAADFHARYDALGKEYRYFIYNGEIPPPDRRLYTAWVRPRLSVAAMNAAASGLTGECDFAAFSANPHREIGGTIRRIDLLKASRRGPEITLIARGNGFLYKMVRSLAGFLIRVGAGEIPPEAAHEILHSKVRTARVPTAHPQGLFLWKVFYAPESFARD